MNMTSTNTLKGILISAFAAFVFFTAPMVAPVNAILWCHCAESGVCNTLDLPQQALENAGHIGANGNPLHAGDQAGVCTAENEATPTPTPTDEEPPAVPEFGLLTGLASFATAAGSYFMLKKKV